MALPMPLFPPVTMADLPFKSMTTPSLRGLLGRRGAGGSGVCVFLPVDALLTTSIQHLNRSCSAEVAPSPIDEGFDFGPDAGHQQSVHTEPGGKGDRTVELVPLPADFRHG